MKKLTKVLAIGLATSMFTVSVMASTQNVTSYLQQQEHLKTSYNKQYSDKTSSSPYNIRTRVVDKYGNILGVNTKWHGNTSIINPELTQGRKEGTGSVKYSISRPYFYTSVIKEFAINKHVVHTEILLGTSKVVNTVTGKVENLGTNSVENLYIAIQSPDISKYNQDALLKVQGDGTFKIDNLMDGEYKVNLIKLIDKDEYKASCVKVSESISVKVNKNTIVNIIYPSKTNNEIQGVDVTSYYSDIDRSNPMIYVGHTEYSKPPQLLVDMANEIKEYTEGKTDLEKVKAILKTMNSSNVSRHGTIRNHPVIDIIKDGKIYYESCGDFANVFVALARELGLPANYAQAVGLGQNYSDAIKYKNGILKNVEAHQNVELYLTDESKWILVEPHFCDIITNYDPTNPYVAYKGTDLNLPQDGIYYFYIKSSDNNFKKLHEFTLKNIDTTIAYEPQVYDLKLDYNK